MIKILQFLKEPDLNKLDQKPELILLQLDPVKSAAICTGFALINRMGVKEAKPYLSERIRRIVERVFTSGIE
jgi:hypothetical protein